MPAGLLLDELAACPGKAVQYDWDRKTSARINKLICDCLSAEACKSTHAPYPLGHDCCGGEDCEGNFCDSTIFIGLCSKPCSATDDCGSGFARLPRVTLEPMNLRVLRRSSSFRLRID
jgi:hypothetical protein